MIEHRDVGHSAATILSPRCRTADHGCEIVAPAASPEEAAAVVAALERFMRETAPAAGRAAARRATRGSAPRSSRRPAASRTSLSPWGDPHPWGAVTAK